MSDKLNDASKNLQEQYAKAEALKQQQQRGLDSQQVKNTRNAPELPPPKGIGREVKRNSHQEAMKQDAERVKKHNESINAQKQQDLQQDKNKNNDDKNKGNEER